MNVTEFAKKYNLNQRDTSVCISVYKQQEKTEEEWKTELSGKVNLRPKSVLETEKVVEEIQVTTEESDKEVGTKEEKEMSKAEKLKEKIKDKKQK